MPKVTDAHLEARRTQIIEAACRCFSRTGFHQTTMRDICAEADLSAGAVYAYFKSKDDIIEALAALGRQNTRALLQSFRTEAPSPDALATLLRRLLECLDSDAGRESSRLDIRLWGEALHTPAIRSIFLEALPVAAEPFRDTIQKGQASGELDATIDPDAAARLFVAIYLGLEVQKAMQPDLGLDGCADTIAALLAGRFSRGSMTGGEA